MSNPDYLKFLELEPEKVTLAEQSQLYLDALLKYLQILYYTQELGSPKVTKITEVKIVPIMEQMAEEMNKLSEEYVRKNGDI